MSRTECDVFCLKYQLTILQRKWYVRLLDFLARPFLLLQERLNFHKRARRR